MPDDESEESDKDFITPRTQAIEEEDADDELASDPEEDVEEVFVSASLPCSGRRFDMTYSK